jgi:hypothetical protein
MAPKPHRLFYKGFIMKEVQMTFRVEPELRAEFSEAVILEDRPAAQVLREFMRAYVNQSRERLQNDQITPEEMYRRERAVNFARASVALEGFKPYEEDEELSRRYIAGEITISDAIKALDDSLLEQ